MKIIRVTTAPMTLYTFCRGLLAELSSDYDVVAVASPGPELDGLAKSDGVRCVAVGMMRHISPLKDLVSLVKLIRVFAKERPQMVHSMTPKAGLLSMMAARVCGVPIRVHTFTGLVFPTATGLKKRILIFTDRLTCSCATHVIPEGEGVKHDLLSYGITSKPMQVLGNGNVMGIDLQRYDRTSEVLAHAAEIRSQLGFEKDAFVFVFVGRLVRDKGINELVEAFDLMSRRFGNVHLLLVGNEEPELDPLTTKAIETIRSNSRIHAVGKQRDVRPWYAASDALVFPSYREGFPNVVIEAGAMGLPSIVTDINGSREIIRQNENGVIIPSHDKEALMQAMESFVVNLKSTQEMAAQSRQLIASRYEQSFVRQCLKDFYHSVLYSKRQG